MPGRIVHEPASMSSMFRTHARVARRVMLTALVASLAACGTFNDATRGMADALTIYKPEVVQGNFVSKEQVAALHPGMTRLQVRDVLGTPLMASVFHGNRWDYVFTIKRRGVDEQRYRLTVFFDGDTLARFESDDMPGETEFVQRISRERKFKVPVLEASEEQLAKFPAAGASAPERAGPESPATPAGGYPPLEPVR